MPWFTEDTGNHGCGYGTQQWEGTGPEFIFGVAFVSSAAMCSYLPLR